MTDSNHTDSLLTEPHQDPKDSPPEDIKASLRIQEAIKRAVGHVGNQNRYQVMLAVYLSLCFIAANYFNIGNSYLFMNPSFQCAGVDATENEACRDIQQCTVKNDYTITAHLEMYCGQGTNRRDTVQSMLGLGAVFGVLLINLISDYKGRKFAFILTLAVEVISALTVLIGAYANIFVLLAVSQFLAGFTSASMFTLIYVLADKLLSKKWSQTAITLANATLGITQISMLAWTYLTNWKYYTFIGQAGMSVVLLAIAPWLLVEDPVLLFSKKKYKECMESLNKIAKINDKESEIDKAKQIVDELKQQEHAKDNQQSQSSSSVKAKVGYLATLKNWSILKPVICFGAFVFYTHLASYMISYCANQIGYSYGINTATFGVTTIIGLIPLMKFGNQTPRKKSSLAFVLIMSILSLLFVFHMHKALQTAVVALIHVLVSNSYVIYVFFVVETFPQHIQSSCFGIIQTVGEVGKFLAPLGVRLANEISISPLLIVAAANLSFGIFSLLPLKETLKVKQENHVNDHNVKE